MKKQLLLSVFLMIFALLLLASCGGGGEEAEEPSGGRELMFDGESYVIFGTESKSNFEIIYDSDNTKFFANLAVNLCDLVVEKGLPRPIFAADRDRTEAKLEFIIGDTDRAISAEAKAIVEENAAKDPNGKHWVWLYKDGQLALYASKDSVYELAMSEFSEKYFKDGVFKVKKDAKEIGHIEGPRDTYMSYEVYDNFFDGYTDPFAMEEWDYKEMTFTRVNETTYHIEYKDDNGGTWHSSFVMKKWGCWMMGELIYVDRKGNSSMLQPASTDYEFVLTCAGKDKLTFRGGNHGDYPKVYGDGWVWDAEDSSKSNDRLLDMTFYDGKSGDKVELKVGESKKLNGLRIVIHNNIYELDYKVENVLINVEKSYLFNGYDILLDSKLYMTQDVKFSGATYTCMLPIKKPYSNNMLLYNTDGTTTYVKTVLEGDNNYKPNSTGHNATKVEVWGDNNPALHMTVEIFNPEHQMMSSHPTKGYIRLWDMNPTGNKIYFSAFTNNQTLDWGTELNFRSKWSFSYQPDFKGLDIEPEFTVGYPR